MILSTAPAAGALILMTTLSAPVQTVQVRPAQQASTLRVPAVGSGLVSDHGLVRVALLLASTVDHSGDDFVMDDSDLITLTEADTAMLRTAARRGLDEFDFSEFYDADDE